MKAVTAMATRLRIAFAARLSAKWIPQPSIGM